MSIDSKGRSSTDRSGKCEGILDRLFVHEEINGRRRCPTYLHRWVVLKTGLFSIYLHKFIGSDWSRDLHDHPWWAVNIGISGSYVEETPGGRFRRHRAPWFRVLRPEHRHRVWTEEGHVTWTLMIVTLKVRMWGFWVGGKWIPWNEYVFGPLGDAGKDC